MNSTVQLDGLFYTIMLNIIFSSQALDDIQRLFLLHFSFPAGVVQIAGCTARANLLAITGIGEDYA